MSATRVLTGTLTDPKTMTLDEPLDAASNPVRVVITLPGPVSTKSWREVLDEIHEGQRQRGHVPPTQEEVEASMREMRG